MTSAVQQAFMNDDDADFFPPMAMPEPIDENAPSNETSPVKDAEEEERKDDHVKKSKSAKIGADLLDILLYAGELIVPILFWSATIALIGGYINKANWNFNTRMMFYWIIAILCLVFLLIRHGATMAKKLPKM